MCCEAGASRGRCAPSSVMELDGGQQCDRRQRYGGRHGTRWITHVTWRLALVYLVGCCGVALAQEEAAAPNAGPCNPSTPCVPGEVYGDPQDCNKYYECIDSSLTLQSCDEGKLFDNTLLACGFSDEAQCAPPCDSSSSTDKAGEAPPDDPENIVPIDNIPEDGTLPDDLSPGEELGSHNSTSPIAVEDVTLTLPPQTDSEGDTMEPIDVVPPASEDGNVTNTTVVETSLPATATQPSTTESTFGPPTEIGSSDPPYTVFVTVTRPPRPPSTTTTVVSPSNETTEGGTGDLKKGGLSPIMITIIAAVGAAFIVLVIIIIIVICIIRRKKQRKHDIVQLENPRYIREGNGPRDYRFSRDSSLLLRNQKPKNNNMPKPNMNAKKKRPPPPAPQKKDVTPSKRKAPPPPNPFTGEVEDGTPRASNDNLYEKDTEGGSVESLEMTTFSSPTKLPGETSEDGEFDSAEELEETNVGDPLLDEETNRLGEQPEEEDNTPNGQIKQKDVEHPSDSESSSVAGEENHNDNESVEEREIQEDEQGLLENEEDNVSVDSYDKLNNPFFK